nr:DNA topoisomerase IB [Caldimonas tepidiphila]
MPPGLVYVTDTQPGIRRVRRGRGFAYRLPDGRWLSDPAELDRIRRLAIPPAYQEVWICPDPRGHLQATGRDSRGRKQYRYHPQWRLHRDADKFERMRAFGAALPRIRRRVERDLARAGRGKPDRNTVLATLVRLLDTTLVRIGNDEYARQNHSYGLTTLRRRHAALEGSVLRLRFRGKHGVMHEVALEDPRVARVVRRCQAMPGQELFHYPDQDGQSHPIGSAEVNAYLREAAQADFTAKDFRTWHATVHALALMTAPCAEGAQRPTAMQILREVAGRLGNTVAVCRKSYVHPGVLEIDPETHAAVEPPPRRGLDRDELRLLHWLERQQRAVHGRERRGAGVSAPAPASACDAPLNRRRRTRAGTAENPPDSSRTRA